MDHDFRKRLQTYLDDNLISPSEFARRTGVPQPTIHRILSGESREPRRLTIERMQRFMDQPDSASTRPTTRPEKPIFGMILVPHIDTVLNTDTMEADKGRSIVGPLRLRRAWLEVNFPEVDITNLGWGHPGRIAPDLGLSPDDILLIDCGMCDPTIEGGVFAVELSTSGTLTYMRFTRVEHGGLRLSGITPEMVEKAAIEEAKINTVGRAIYVWRGGFI